MVIEKYDVDFTVANFTENMTAKKLNMANICQSDRRMSVF